MLDIIKRYTWVIVVVLPVLTFLVGDNVAFRVTAFLESFSNQSEAASRDIPNDQITAVVYRRGNGGYKTLGNVDMQLEALGYQVERWTSTGMSKVMEDAWGVPKSKYSEEIGGIFYYPELYEKAKEIQSVLIRKNPLLAKTIPMVEATANNRNHFISTHATAGNSVLIYTPG